jgi:hypothetical protein
MNMGGMYNGAMSSLDDSESLYDSKHSPKRGYNKEMYGTRGNNLNFN